MKEPLLDDTERLFGTTSSRSNHHRFRTRLHQAEVVAYADFRDLCEGAKSMAPVKAAGKYRLEGGKYRCAGWRHYSFLFSES